MCERQILLGRVLVSSMQRIVFALLSVALLAPFISMPPARAQDRVPYTVKQFRFKGTMAQAAVWQGGVFTVHWTLAFTTANRGSGEAVGSGQTWDGKATVNVTGTVTADAGQMCSGTSTFTAPIQIEWGTDRGKSRPLKWSFLNPTALPGVCRGPGGDFAFTSQDYVPPFTQAGDPWPAILLAGSDPDPDDVANGKSLSVHYVGRSDWTPPPVPEGSCGRGCHQLAHSLPTHRTYDLSALLTTGEQCKFTVTFVNGGAQVVHGGTASNLHLNGSVVDGDTVQTASNGRVILSAPDGTETRVAPRSEVTIRAIACEGHSQKNNDVKLSFGRIWTKIVSLVGGDERFEFDNGSSGDSRGTIFVIGYDRKSRTSAVHAIEHALRFKAPGSIPRVQQGSCGRVVGDGKPEHVSCAAIAPLVALPLSACLRLRGNGDGSRRRRRARLRGLPRASLAKPEVPFLSRLPRRENRSLPNLPTFRAARRLFQRENERKTLRLNASPRPARPCRAEKTFRLSTASRTSFDMRCRF